MVSDVQRADDHRFYRTTKCIKTTQSKPHNLAHTKKGANRERCAHLPVCGCIHSCFHCTTICSPHLTYHLPDTGKYRSEHSCGRITCKLFGVKNAISIRTDAIPMTTAMTECNDGPILAWCSSSIVWQFLFVFFCVTTIIITSVWTGRTARRWLLRLCVCVAPSLATILCILNEINHRSKHA